MGEIADAMLSGAMCEMCGVPLCSTCADGGVPMYCSNECAKDRGASPYQVCHHEEEEEGEDAQD